MESEGYPVEGKFSLINKSGKQLIPFKYDWIYYFYEGLAKVQIGNKYGFIDVSGKEVFKVIYDEARNFSNGKVWVEKDGEWKLMVGHDDIATPYQ